MQKKLGNLNLYLNTKKLSKLTHFSITVIKFFEKNFALNKKKKQKNKKTKKNECSTTYRPEYCP